jgi:DNA-binding PadR family transcriptional regulator
MSTSSFAYGPGIGRGPWAIPEEIRRAKRAHMSGGGHGRGPWGPPGGRGRRGGPDWGFGPMGGPGGWPFGPGPGGRAGRGRGGRGRAGRGDVRTAILALLADGPRHGYQIIQDITERSEGAWRPSPGSVYPALSALADEGLVDDEKVEGRRVFALTDEGTAYVAEHADELDDVFENNTADAEDEGVTDLRQLLFAVGGAAVQVVSAGTPEQVAAARTVLTNARRDLYRILAEEE